MALTHVSGKYIIQSAILVAAHTAKVRVCQYTASLASSSSLRGKALTTRATHKLAGMLYVEMVFKIVNDERLGVLGSLAIARNITQRYLAERAGRNP